MRLVHGVRREQQAIGARRRQTPGRIDDQRIAAREVVDAVEGGIFLEVEAFHYQPGAVQPSQPLCDSPIDMLVIERGRRPARPANDPQLAQNACPFPLSHCRERSRRDTWLPRQTCLANCEVGKT